MEMNPEEKIRISFRLNGREVEAHVLPGETALHLLRERLGLRGVKEGCGIGECGACTIVVDKKAVNSCLMLAAQLHGCEVLTVEGLESPVGLHPLQEAFLEHDAIQCGFCTPGMLLSAYALIVSKGVPTREEIVRALAGNLCRCTGYHQIVDAVQDAARRMAGKEEGRW
jgi:carbon-monoxide dehydrogenase small subunit